LFTGYSQHVCTVQHVPQHSVDAGTDCVATPVNASTATAVAIIITFRILFTSFPWQNGSGTVRDVSATIVGGKNNKRGTSC
jgi:hypothetical protein